jgi:branched-chain amino acid transport system substrate-binding protein
MKKWNNIMAVLMTMIILLGIFASACAKPAPPQSTGPITINIGLPCPLSGPAGAWGKAGTVYHQAWVDLINQQGGFKIDNQTYNIKLVIVDDKNTSEGGAAAAKQLIYGDNCKFLAGHWSWNFAAIAAVTNPAKIIFVTRTGNDAVPGPGGGYDPVKQPYTVFGTAAAEIYSAYIAALVEYFPDYKKIAIIDSTAGKGKGMEDLFKWCDKNGIRYYSDFYAPGTADFTPYITKVVNEGCDIVSFPGDVAGALAFAKQRWEMGYKDMKVGTSGPIMDTQLYINTCGYDAAQGFFGSYAAPWEFKHTKVDPKYLSMCQEVMQIVSEKQGKTTDYVGWIPWFPTHSEILIQAMQKAGTVDDPDAIMKVIRGGTFDTPIGTYKMVGKETYGSPVVFLSSASLGQIQGNKVVFMVSHTSEPLP